MKYIKEMIAPYQKALVPLVIAGVLSGLASMGIFAEMTVEQVVTLVVTAFFVWLVPNKK